LSEAADNAIEQLEDQLEGAARTLSALSSLTDQQAQRVAQRMDRLASQLLEVSAPPAMNDVHSRLGTHPVKGALSNVCSDAWKGDTRNWTAASVAEAQTLAR